MWAVVASITLLLPHPLVAQDAARDRGDPADSIERLVRRSIDAYGGEDALRAAAIVVQRGTVTSSMREGPPGALVRIYERPIRLRVEIEYPESEPETRILDGGLGWRNGLRASGPMYDAMLLQAARLGLPMILLDFVDSLEDHGELVREGSRRRVIGLGFHGGLHVKAEIEAATGRILRTEGTIEGGSGRPPLTFATEYAGFRDVGGVLVPFHEVNFAQGTRTGETRIESVELLDRVPSGTFHPPVAPPPGSDARRSTT